MAEQTFTDPLAQEYYRQGEMELESAQSAEAVLRQAEAFGPKRGAGGSHAVGVLFFGGGAFSGKP